MEIVKTKYLEEADGHIAIVTEDNKFYVGYNLHRCNTIKEVEESEYTIYTFDTLPEAEDTFNQFFIAKFI